MTPDGRTHVFHQYTIDVGGARDAIVTDLREAGVGADIYYPIPVHRQSYIMERGLHADLPVTDAAAARTLALPMFPGLTDVEQDEVIDAVRPPSSASSAPVGGRRRRRPAARARDRRRSRGRSMTSSWRPAGDATLRVGLAGLGSMGRNHLRILAGRDDIRLAAVADPVARRSPRTRPGRPAPRASPSRSR